MKNTKYREMIKSFTKGDTATARKLALELQSDTTLKAPKMKDVLHVVEMTSLDALQIDNLNRSKRGQLIGE